MPLPVASSDSPASALLVCFALKIQQSTRAANEYNVEAGGARATRPKNGSFFDPWHRVERQRSGLRNDRGSRHRQAQIRTRRENVLLLLRRLPGEIPGRPRW